MEYIDTSSTSLVIGLSTFAIILLLVRYIFITYYNVDYINENGQVVQKYENSTITIFSAFIGLICGLLLMMFYKKYLIYKGSNSIITEPFYS